ncbi:hypothetical protein OnM2_020017 [Erysiphe neolycopersici]|uniref:Uncharacterized protein n=1 Tax=Erysiphe neolycopersici TaxID=212602 RepID=A0A420I3P6_9PEZI|nr:hypothetical protein OnM2_020017 [Erysiphe neolycopersici]
MVRDGLTNITKNEFLGCLQEKVGSSIESIVRPGVTLTPDTVRNINSFIKWGISNTTELVQVKKDLRRTKYAERIQKTRRAFKNRPLKSGGVLTVAEVRKMVKQVEDQAVEKAIRLVEVTDLKLRNSYKRWFFEAAKEARKWRCKGKLSLAAVFEAGKECRLLRRF